eukprot:8887606-Heterocapsa_arctica.AAC.1
MVGAVVRAVVGAVVRSVVSAVVCSVVGAVVGAVVPAVVVGAVVRSVVGAVVRAVARGFRFCLPAWLAGAGGVSGGRIQCHRPRCSSCICAFSLLAV